MKTSPSDSKNARLEQWLIACILIGIKAGFTVAEIKAGFAMTSVLMDEVKARIMAGKKFETESASLEDLAQRVFTQQLETDKSHD